MYLCTCSTAFQAAPQLCQIQCLFYLTTTNLQLKLLNPQSYFVMCCWFHTFISFVGFIVVFIAWCLVRTIMISWMLTTSKEYRILAKKGPWVVHITLCSDRGVGGYLYYRYLRPHALNYNSYSLDHTPPIQPYIGNIIRVATCNDVCVINMLWHINYRPTSHAYTQAKHSFVIQWVVSAVLWETKTFQRHSQFQLEWHIPTCR